MLNNKDKIEEFLDEKIIINENTKKKNVEKSDNDFKNDSDNDSENDSENNSENEDEMVITVEDDDILESDLSFEIIKKDGKKKLNFVVKIYDDDEILKLNYEIKKSTLKKLLKDLDD